MPVISATWEAEAENHLNQEKEVAVSQDYATALQPGKRMRLHLKKRKEKKKLNKKRVWKVVRYCFFTCSFMGVFFIIIY